MLSARNRSSLLRIALVALTAIALAACGGDDDDPSSDGTPQGTQAPAPTLEPIPTFDPRTSTPSAGDFIGVITIDTDPATPAIDHGDVTAAPGANFEIPVVINQPPEAFRGYQVALGWDDNGILAFVSENAPMPAGMTLCSAVQPLLGGTLPQGRIGVYGGCLNPDGAELYTGLVSTLTFTCSQPGTIGLRMLSINEAQSLGTSLILENGETTAGEVDNGITITCT